MDDLFNVLDDDKSAFEELTETPKESKPFSFKKKKINYWEETDIKQLDIDVSKFDTTKKSFVIYTHPDRDLGEEAKELIHGVAKALMAKGFTFRHTGGEDNELQNLILQEEGFKETYLPWKKFNSKVEDPLVSKPSDDSFGIAVTYHKGYAKLPPAIRFIIARDVNALLGHDLTKPTTLVLGWSEDGLEAIGKEKIDFKKSGNLSYIIRIATDSNIPVFNLKNKESLTKLKEFISK